MWVGPLGFFLFIIIMFWILACCLNWPVCVLKSKLCPCNTFPPPTASSIIPFPLPSKIPFTLNVVHLNIWLLSQYLKEFITFSITLNYQIVGFYLYNSAISNLFKLFEFSLNIILPESCVLHLAVCQWEGYPGQHFPHQHWKCSVCENIMTL